MGESQEKGPAATNRLNPKQTFDLYSLVSTNRERYAGMTTAAVLAEAVETLKFRISESSLRDAAKSLGLAFRRAYPTRVYAKPAPGGAADDKLAALAAGLDAVAGRLDRAAQDIGELGLAVTSHRAIARSEVQKIADRLDGLGRAVADLVARLDTQGRALGDAVARLKAVERPALPGTAGPARG
jgi:hypothetical protein